MKKTVSFLLALIFTLGMFGGLSAFADEAEPSDPYAYTFYYDYDWWDVYEWGTNEISSWYNEKFNVDVTLEKPDADAAEARLNLMIAGDDLPDAIIMERNANWIKMARMGLFVPLNDFPEVMAILEEEFLPSTLEELSIDGKLYGIPNWARKAASGGNYVWMYDQRLYELCGSPKLETLEDLYQFAVALKELGTTPEGLPIIPFMSDFFENGDGNWMAKAFYRSFGGVYPDIWYTAVDGKLQHMMRDPVFRDATMEMNKWWRDRLIGETQFTDDEDMILEKMVNGRIGLMFYDFSKDEYLGYRAALADTIPGDDIQLVKPFPFPPANGLPVEKIYGDHQSTLGWNVTNITTSAKDPERIALMWAHFLTREGTIVNMYGPQGFMWDELDEEGLPILKKPESEWTEDEMTDLGVWVYLEQCGNSDLVDGIKFAINESLPKEQRNWVISEQFEYLTPTLWISDEFENLGLTIDGDSEQGINRALCEDRFTEVYPQIIMADTREEAERLYDELLAFFDAYGMLEIEAIYDAKYQDNVLRYGSGLVK